MLEKYHYAVMDVIWNYHPRILFPLYSEGLRQHPMLGLNKDVDTLASKLGWNKDVDTLASN